MKTYNEFLSEAVTKIPGFNPRYFLSDQKIPTVFDWEGHGSGIIVYGPTRAMKNNYSIVLHSYDLDFTRYKVFKSEEDMMKVVNTLKAKKIIKIPDDIKQYGFISY